MHEKLEGMCTELAGSEADGPPNNGGTKKICSRKINGRILPEGVSVVGNVDVEHLKYCCAANIMVASGHTVLPLMLKGGVGQWFRGDGYVGAPTQSDCRRTLVRCNC